MSRLVSREAITPTNQSPVFLIVTWISQAAVLLVVAVKVLLSYTSTGIHADDWCILTAAVLSIVQVVAVSFQGMNGIGKVQSTLSPYQLSVYEKAAYTAEILYVLILVISKISVVMFLYQITPFTLWRRITALVGVFTALWGISSVFVIAFQCNGPRRWDTIDNHCIDRLGFWTANLSLNIASELAIILVPFSMFFVLISSMSKKVILMFCFSLRFSVIAVVALQLYYLHHPVHPSTPTERFDNDTNDYTFSSWPVFLTAQIIQSLSIITTCVPFMRTLFLGLETGMIQTGHVSRRKVGAAFTSRNDTSNESSNQLSVSGGRIVPANDRSSRNIQMSHWRFNHSNASNTSANSHAHDSESMTLLDAGQLLGPPSNNSSGPLSESSTNPVPHEVSFSRRRSSSGSPGSSVPRTPTTPTFPRRGSSTSPNPPGLEPAVSRRQVSMIVEEEEEEDSEQRQSLQAVDVLTALPETTAMFSDPEAGEIQRPQHTLDSRVPSGRFSMRALRNTYAGERLRQLAGLRNSTQEREQDRGRPRSREVDYARMTI